MSKRTGKQQSRTRGTGNKVLKHKAPKRATAAGRMPASESGWNHDHL